MKLISNFHDYYDSMFKYGTDDKSVFKRETKNIPIKHDPIYNSRDDKFQTFQFEAKTKDFDYEFNGGIIGFCGKIYPFIKLKKRSKNFYISTTVEIYYSFEDMCNDNPEILSGELKHRYRITSSKISHIKDWLNDGIVHKWNDDYNIINDPVVLSQFEQLNVAYFSYSGCVYSDTKSIDRLEVYPSLKEFQFFKLMDITQTYQNLEMYLTNILVNKDNPYIQPVADKIKAESHGYDKFSFRKEKSNVK